MIDFGKEMEKYMEKDLLYCTPKFLQQMHFQLVGI